MAIGTVVVTSGICALCSDAIFTAIAFVIGRKSVPTKTVITPKKRYRLIQFLVR